jgi:hypothetical protein
MPQCINFRTRICTLCPALQSLLLPSRGRCGYVSAAPLFSLLLYPELLDVLMPRGGPRLSC